MILVTLGTQDKQFIRLLKVIDNAIRRSEIKDEVIAQIGHTVYKTSRFKTYKFMSEKRLNELIEEADLIVSHGGIGNLTTALSAKKKIFVMPRLKMYNEHVNDHQEQVVEEFKKLGYVKRIDSYDDFVSEYKNLSKFKPKFPKFDNSKMLNIIKEFIG